MPASSDDDVEEYLDDPISLVAFENIKTERCDSANDHIIDLGESTDEESKCISSYGKKSFVLPVTFFDISRNVRLLNRCKPMSIRIVDCEQHPSYYGKYIPEKCRNQPEDSGIEVVIKSENNNEAEPNNVNPESAVNDIIQENTNNMQGKLKKRRPRGDSFYEKLKRRKERRKESALKCKDLSRVDFKRNKGLVGLKITGNIFKKIVDTERALSKVKSITGEKTSKDKFGSDREKTINDLKTNIAKGESKEESETNTKGKIRNGNLPDNKCKEQTKNDKLTTCIGMYGDLSSTDDKYKEKNESNIKTSIIEATSNSSNDKCKSSKTDTDKMKSLNKNNISDNKYKEKCEMNTKMTIVEVCGKNSDVKSKDSELTDSEKYNIGMESNFAENKSRVKGATSTNKITVGTKNNFCEDKCKKNVKFHTKKPDIHVYSCKDESTKITLTATTTNTSINNIYTRMGENNTNLPLHITKSPVPKLEENRTNSTYLKKVGTALDNLGTSNIPIEDDNTKNHVPKNTNTDGNNDKNRVKVDDRPAIDIEKPDNNNGNNKMRCSLKISCKKALKLKQTKCNEPSLDMSNTVVKQHARDIKKKYDQKIHKRNLKRNSHDFESFYLVPSKIKKHCNSQKSTSNESKRVETSTAKNAKVNDQAGSNSPVIPCTTITFRAAQPKLSSVMPVAKNLSQIQKHTTDTLTNNQKKSDINEVTSNNIQTNSLPMKPSNVFFTNEANLSKNHDDLAYSKNSLSRSNIVANVKSSSGNSTAKVAERKYPHIFIRTKDSKNSGSGPIVTENRLLDQTLSHPPINGNPVMTLTKSASTGNVTPASNRTTNDVIQNQTNPNSKVASLPSFIRSLSSSYSGHNAIILRRPPASCHLQKNMSPIQGQPIQTVVNRFQSQPFPVGGGTTRFQAQPRYIRPNTNVISNISPAWPTHQHFIHQREMPPASHMRGVEMGLPFWRSQFPEYRLPIDLRPPPPPPKPVLPTTSVSSPMPAPTPAPDPAPPPSLGLSIMPPPQNSFKNNLGPANVSEISKDSVIGSTPNGELIKKINISKPGKIVSDKEIMLAELNNAVMSPELAIIDPEDKEITLRKLENSDAAETAKPKHSKPCPLSKKIKDTQNEIPEKLYQNIGYSPPILPILTYEEILSRSDKYKTAAPKSGTRTAANKKDNTTQKIKIPLAASEKPYKAKKISFQDYRKRISKDDVDRIDASKIRKTKNVADDYNQDQGYDSDSTVKL